MTVSIQWNMRQRLAAAALALAGTLARCGGDSGTEPTPPPAIALTPTTVGFAASAGGSNPAAQPVAVTNGGGGTLSGLSFSISYAGGQPTGWLTASLSSPTEPSTLMLQAATGVLAPGSYSATVTVSSPAASNGPQNVSVTFAVLD